MFIDLTKISMSDVASAIAWTMSSIQWTSIVLCLNGQWWQWSGLLGMCNVHVVSVSVVCVCVCAGLCLCEWVCVCVFVGVRDCVCLWVRLGECWCKCGRLWLCTCACAWMNLRISFYGITLYRLRKRSNLVTSRLGWSFRIDTSSNYRLSLDLWGTNFL